jgi:antitoxin (DNA-binding transcriptional repressor) of toxin-antitoxin stability system
LIQRKQAILNTISLEEAQANLTELVENLAPGEEIMITRGQQAVAKLVGQGGPVRKPRQPGGCKGMITLLVEDNEHLKDFAEYTD